MKQLKRIICLGLVAMLAVLWVPQNAGATIRSETIDFHGVELRCDVSNLGILQISPSPEQQKQVLESLRKAAIESPQDATVELDISKIKGIKGYAVCLDQWHPLVVEYSDDVKLFISPQAAAVINDHTGSRQAVLEVKYIFAADNSVTGIDLSLRDLNGKDLDIVGVVCFPASSDSLNTVLKKDGQIIAKSGVQNGLFYSALCLNGQYSVAEAEPLIFDDEVPSWARSSVDWLSARGVVFGSNGNFRPDAGITRAEFLTMFERLYNRGEPSAAETIEYKDLDDTPHWAKVSYTAIFLTDESRDYLYPNKVMTRREMVKVLGGDIRIADLFYDNTKYETPFSDMASPGDQQAYDVNVLSRTGIMKGYGGAAKLDETATRAQAAELLCRFAKWETLNRTYR